MSDPIQLAAVYEGWGGYNDSIMRAVESLTVEQLDWRPKSDMRSVGEVVRHIALGRLGWFVRMQAPGSAELAERIPTWHADADGNRHIDDEAVVSSQDPKALVQWLRDSWQMVEATLTTWTVADLSASYRHKFRGTVYSVSRQWTIWRIMAHDIHHGGQLAEMLDQQGVAAFELIGLGGHIVEPPEADGDDGSGAPVL